MPLGVVIPLARFVALDDNGNILPGAKMQCWLANSSTPQPLYTTEDLNIALTNPVEADANGLFPAMYTAPVSLKLELRTAADVVIWQQDEVTPASLMTGLINSQQFRHWIGAPQSATANSALFLGGSIVANVMETEADLFGVETTLNATAQPAIAQVVGIESRIGVSLGATGTPAIAGARVYAPVITSGGAVPAENVGLDVIDQPTVGTRRYALQANGTSRLGSLILSSNITGAALVGNTDDYAGPGMDQAGIYRISASSPVNLTGIDSAGVNGPSSSVNVTGRVIVLMNVGSNTITLVNDATSIAANRFLLPGGSNFSLTAGLCVALIYDGVSSRWRIIG